MTRPPPFRRAWAWARAHGLTAIACTITATWLMSAIPPPSTSADWAAWVQGAGTLIAVVVALWAGSLQLTQHDRIARQARIDFALAIRAALEHVQRRLSDLRVAVDESDPYRAHVAMVNIRNGEFDATLEGFMAITPNAWPSTQLYAATRAYLGVLRRLLTLPSNLSALEEDIDGERRAFITRLSHRLTWILNHHALVDALISQVLGET